MNENVDLIGGSIYDPMILTHVFLFLAFLNPDRAIPTAQLFQTLPTAPIELIWSANLTRANRCLQRHICVIQGLWHSYCVPNAPYM